MFSSPKLLDQLWRSTDPSAQWVPVTFLLGLKLQKYEFNHSPASSTEVKNEWSYITLTPIRLQGMNSENCTLTFI